MDRRKSYNNILIILTGSLGDILRAISIIPPLKRAFPESRITWLAESRWAEIVKLCEGVDETLIFKRSFRAFPGTVAEIRRKKFDLVLDLQRIFKSGILSFLSAAPVRIGFHQKNSKEFNFIFNNQQIIQAENYLSKIKHYHLFLEKIAVPSAEPYSFPLPIEKLKSENKISGDYFALVLGSSWQSKDWLAEGYRDLIRLLLDKYSEKIILLGDNTKKDLADMLVADSRCNRVISLCGKTTLTELLSVISAAKVVIGPDSGPGHMAAAVGKPYITLYGPTSADRVSPYGYANLSVLSPIVCSPCWRKNCPGLNKTCMRLISPEQILQTLETI
jgi:heptosyltransferase-1